ncbi:hypothetical protein BESB_084760 [Besnoitia besnoiti]|uniref:Transmembrane protein n=1 Tax=Besnoitia besnoiti TaxID=94643 RepID=A0A2A9MCE0_BESBE|nr:hypothetical protein BESB_084760 [Besnoitia besnoiti]PFH33277.1 hypothetical protein BESB_084760 [Besnoitia besnoiti]
MTLLRCTPSRSHASPCQPFCRGIPKSFVAVFALLRRLLVPSFRVFLWVVYPVFCILYFLHQTPSHPREHLATVDAFLACAPADLLQSLFSSVLLLSNSVVLAFFALSLDCGRLLVASLRLLFVWANFLWPYCRPALLHLWACYLDLSRVHQAAVAGVSFAAVVLSLLYLNGTLSRAVAAGRRAARRVSRWYVRVTAAVAASAPFVLACLFYLGMLLILGPARREQLQCLLQVLWHPLVAFGTAACLSRYVYLPRLHPILQFCKPQGPPPGRAPGGEARDSSLSTAGASAVSLGASRQGDALRQRKQGASAPKSRSKAETQGGDSAGAAAATEGGWACFRRWAPSTWRASPGAAAGGEEACRAAVGGGGDRGAEEGLRGDWMQDAKAVCDPEVAKAIAGETRYVWMRLTFWLEVWVFMTACNLVAELPLLNRYVPFVESLPHHVLSLFSVLTVISGGPSQPTVHRAAFRLIRGLAALLSFFSTKLFGVALVLPSHGADASEETATSGIFYFPEPNPPAFSRQGTASPPRTALGRGLRQAFSFFLPFVSSSNFSLNEQGTSSPSSRGSLPGSRTPASASPLVSYAADALCHALGFSSQSWLSGLFAVLLYLPQVLLIFLPQFVLTPVLVYLRAGRPLFGAIVSLSSTRPSALSERLYWVLYFLASSGVSLVDVLLKEHNLLRYLPFQSSFLVLVVVTMQTAVTFLAKGAEVRVRLPQRDPWEPTQSFSRAGSAASRASSVPQAAAAEQSGREGAAPPDRSEARQSDARKQRGSWFSALFGRGSSVPAAETNWGAPGGHDAAAGVKAGSATEEGSHARPKEGTRHILPAAMIASAAAACEKESSGRPRAPPPAPSPQTSSAPSSSDIDDERARAEGGIPTENPEEDEDGNAREAIRSPEGSPERAGADAACQEPRRRWADEAITSSDEEMEQDGFASQAARAVADGPEAGSRSASRVASPRSHEGRMVDRGAPRMVWRARAGDGGWRNFRDDGRGRRRPQQKSESSPAREGGSPYFGPGHEDRRSQQLFSRRGARGGRSRREFPGGGSAGNAQALSKDLSEEQRRSPPDHRRRGRPVTPPAGAGQGGDRERLRLRPVDRRADAEPRGGAAPQRGRLAAETDWQGAREEALQEWNLVDDDLSEG